MVEEKFKFLAELSSLFPDNKKPILVGGSAVELYTRGMAKSIDLDVIGDRIVIAPILLKQGFKQEGRHFYKGRIDIEIPSDMFQGRSIIIKYGDKKIKIISVEDLIIDRLCACNFWKSIYDCEQAQMLIRAYKTILDRLYLNERAKQEMLSERF
jgi:hypothetical protein